MFARLPIFIALTVLMSGSAKAEGPITLDLTPAEVVAIVRAMDRWPISQRTPPGFFEVQIKIGRALGRNPGRREEVKKLEHSR